MAEFTEAQAKAAIKFVDIAEDRGWTNERKKSFAASRLQSEQKISREDADTLVELAVSWRKRVPA